MRGIKTMNVMGLGGSLHDFSACIVNEQGIQVAIEDERITRVKHGIDKFSFEKAILTNQLWKFTKKISEQTITHSVEYCLKQQDLHMSEIDLVVTTDSILYLPFFRKLNAFYVINHHLAHAASAFYPSDFEEAAILIIDGQGSEVSYKKKIGYETVTLAYGKGDKIEILDKVLDESLGHFYEAVTLALGFGILEDGKVMGLSSYGKSGYETFLAQTYRYEKEQVCFNCTSKEIRHLVETKIVSEAATGKEEFQVKADLALAVQSCLEEMVLFYVQRLFKLTGCKNICLAGGVALNSVANGKVLRNGQFENLFVQPAAGDNGLAIGCGLYGERLLRSRNEEEIQ